MSVIHGGKIRRQSQWYNYIIIAYSILYGEYRVEKIGDTQLPQPSFNSVSEEYVEKAAWC